MSRRPKTIEQRREYYRRERAKMKGKTAVNHYVCRGASPEDVAARLADIPPDTRGVTGLLMGDPLPGDRRRIDMSKT